MAQPANDVKAIFIAAIDHEPGAPRAAYLDAACGENAGLRRRVEALLVAHERANELLGDGGEPPGTPIPESSSPVVSSTDAYEATAGPDVLIAGRYKLVEKLGEGGMGEVWVAKQSEPVKRKVALKLIKTGMDSRAVLARFEQERQALAMMDHPNIARVLDGGLTPSGQPFFVMELVNGLPLTRFCDEAKLTPKERLELFVPICQAVQHAHQKGIVHRDLKPANILVTIIDGKPVPKVIDFGVAKATGGKLTDESMSTQFGAVVGTLEYMSPEQAGFSGVDVDTRADIYSLGVILYELLTGLRPIDAKRLRGAALAEMIRIIQEEQPSKPSTRLSTDESLPSLAALRHMEPKRLIALLRGELDWLVMRCLEKSRERRYETVNGLARDIQRYLADEPVEARPPSAGYRLSKFLHRNKGPVLAASLVLLALVAGLALASYGFVRAKSERDLAEKAQSQALEQKKIADKATVEALAQKKTANEQKDLALENARKSDKNARKAELNLAEVFISQADTMRLDGRVADAHRLYSQAYDKLLELNAPVTAPEIGLWSIDHQTASPLLSVAAHPAVEAVAIAADGQLALSGGSDGKLKLWNLATLTEVRSFTGHTDTIVMIAISADGQTAYSAGADQTLRLWDLATGRQQRTFAMDQWMSTASVARDGRAAISGGESLKLWEVSSGRELRELVGPWPGYFKALCAAISPDGRTALSGMEDRTLKLWDLASGKELHTLVGHFGAVLCIAISPDGRSALSGSSDGTLRLWDLASGKELRSMSGHYGPVSCVAIAPDGHTALSGSTDWTLKLWDLGTGEELRSFSGHAGRVSSVSIAPNGRVALSGSGDGSMKLWDLSAGEEVRSLNGGFPSVVSVAIAPDGRTALSSNRVMNTLWDLVTGKKLRTIGGDSGFVTSVAVASDGHTALGANWDDSLSLCDLTSGEELRTFTGHARRINGVAIAPDGRTGLSGSSDSTLKLWDLVNGNELRTLVGHNDEVNNVVFGPNGQTALSGSSDCTLMLWDLATGETLRAFDGHTGSVTSIAIAPDGRTALSGSADTSLKLWNLGSGNVLRTFTGHSEPVYAVAIAPSGRTAVSGSGDDTLKFWDLATGKELRTVSAYQSGVKNVAIGADGRTLLSVGNDKSLKAWYFNRGVARRALEPLVTAAQAKLQRNPGEPAAQATLGEWYAFRGVDVWAIDLLVRARDQGAAVAPLSLARCYWNLKRYAEARREFQVALEQSHDNAERTYLNWCIEAIDTESERKRQQEAITAEEQRIRRANAVIWLARAGKLTKAVDEAAELTKASSWDQWQWYDFACVHSLASAKFADKKKEYADRAIELLKQAVRAGMHDADLMVEDTDLDPLRDRDDFKKLLLEMGRKAAAGTGKQP